MLREGKLIALRAARKLGLTSLCGRSSWRRKRLSILSYHGTSLDDEHQWDPGLFMTASHLRRRMELIRDAGCRVLPLGEAVSRLYDGSLPPRSVALTYDDGTYDFYRQAYPVIKSFDFPVTVYLTTYYADFNRPVYDPMCAYLLWKGRGRAVRWREVFGTGEPIELSPAGIEIASRRLRMYPAERRLSGAQKDDLLNQLAELLEIDYEAILRRRVLHIMKPAEARELAAQGVDFQLHTHRHRVSLDKALFRREILENRARLAEIRDSEATHFCYPGGVHRPEFLPWLREWNIESATTCEPGLASRASDPMLLPRLVDASTCTKDEFLAWLTGTAGFLPLRRPVEAEGQFIEERLPPGSYDRILSATGDVAAGDRQTDR